MYDMGNRSHRLLAMYDMGTIDLTGMVSLTTNMLSGDGPLQDVYLLM